jgi:hypothetical protein
MKLAHALLAMTILAVPAYASEDKAASYQMGTYVSASVAADGTITNTLHGDGTTVAGSVYGNHVAIYSLKVADGVWKLETYTQNKDSMIRQMGMTPMHLKAEKNNPLDLLRGGERVLFRVEKHKQLNGIETSVYIPFAENPNKEFRFIGYFYADAQPLQPQKPSDNVKAMCDSHKLSPELEKLYCVEQPKDAASTPVAQNLVSPSTDAQAPAVTAQFSDADRRTAANLDKLSCAQISTIISNPQLATYLPLTWKTAHEKCKQ